jgi:hypothetical protein
MMQSGRAIRGTVATVIEGGPRCSEFLDPPLGEYTFLQRENKKTKLYL